MGCSREYRLKNALLDVQDNYDFILIDFLYETLLYERLRQRERIHIDISLYLLVITL